MLIAEYSVFKNKWIFILFFDGDGMGTGRSLSRNKNTISTVIIKINYFNLNYFLFLLLFYIYLRQETNMFGPESPHMSNIVVYLKINKREKK